MAKEKSAARVEAGKQRWANMSAAEKAKVKKRLAAAREKAKAAKAADEPKAAAKPKGGKNKGGKNKGGKNGTPAPEVRVEREVVERHVNVPAELLDEKGGYQVTFGHSARRIAGVKRFRTLAEVKEFVGGVNKGWVVVADVRAAARA